MKRDWAFAETACWCGGEAVAEVVVGVGELLPGAWGSGRRRCGLCSQRGDFDMEVDAVEEGAVDALAGFLDKGRAVGAFAFGVAIVTAGAWI